MLKTATVICAKCNKTGKLFGIRTEKRNTGWAFTWAFPMTQENAANEGYDKTIINDSIDTDSSYPGCPYCKTKGFIQCDCGKIMCFDNESKQVTCRFCGNTGTVVSDPWSAVSGGGY